MGDNRRKASSTAGSSLPNLHLQGRKAWGSSSSPERGQPSLPQGRAHLRSTQPAKLGPHRAESARPSAAAPGAPPAGTGVGRGGHRPANSGSDGESEPHPLRQPQTYLQLSGSPGQRPRARGRAPRRSEPLPGTPSISEGEGRGETLGGAATGQRGPSRGARGPGSPLSTRPPSPPPFCLPLGVAAAVLRCRFPGCGHFPASLARAEDWGLLPFWPPGASAACGLPPSARPSARSRASPRVAPA